MARGGKREGAGRPANAKTKVGADLREAAQAFTDDALKTLAEIMRDADQPAASRVSAASAILDRGHGKPTQTVDTTVRTAEVSAEPVASEAEWAEQHAS
jgi:hypothetical protein